MDRTHLCGRCNVGSIPTERTTKLSLRGGIECLRVGIEA